MPGEFTQPPKGPKIGPLKNFDELSDDKKAELGDMKKLAQSGVFKPAEMDPRIEKQEAQAAKEAEATPKKTPEEVAEEYAALQSVIEQEAPIPDILEEDATPTDEDKQSFLRSVLGNTSYKKEYALFGGAAQLWLKDLSTEHEELIFATLAARSDLTTQAEWEVVHDRMRLAFHMETFTKGTVTAEPLGVPKTVDQVLSFVTLRIENTFAQSMLYHAAMYTTRVFQLHLEMLLGSVLRPDFWVAGGQDLPSEPTSPA